MHVHVSTGEKKNVKSSTFASAQKYFKSQSQKRDIDELALYYKNLGMRAVIFDVDNETQTGLRVSNDEVAEAVRKYPDVFTGFAAADPWKGEASIKEVERCANVLGFKGVKFQPISQSFFPNDRRFYPLYESCQRLNLIVLFHTGTTGSGAGSPGGGGLHLKYAQPIPYLDDIAADFPSLRIIGAHPSWPWQEEMLAVARHKSNVYIDLSGWAPKYFPESLVHYADTILKDKVLFGSDYPFMDVERWLKEFSELPIRDEARPMILYGNAAKLLGIEAK